MTPKELEEIKNHLRESPNKSWVYGGASADANNLLKYGSKQGNPEYALKGAELYDALGKGNTSVVKKRLKKSLDNSDNVDPKVYKKIEGFLENHPESEEKKSLENLTKGSEVAGGILGIAGALFFLSPNITGNAIGALSTSATGFLGALCFVGGLTLLIFGTRK